MWSSYPGDCTDTVIGQIMGPDTAGGLSEAVEAKYDPETGRTRVRFIPVLPSDERPVAPDGAGFLRVKETDE